MNELDREKRLTKLRENSRRYYEAHKEEIAEKRKKARREKLDAMTPEERKEYNRKLSEYQKEYKKAHPVQVAIWTQRTWQRKVEQMLAGTEDAEA